MDKQKIAVLGAGSWGNTLAMLLCDKYDVTLWEFDKNVADILTRDRENKKLLPGIPFPDNLTITNNLGDALSDAWMTVFAVPSFALRGLCEQVKKFDTSEQILVSVIKGLEDETFLRMTQIIDTVIPNKRGVVALSGPTHAEEVSRQIPSTIVAACPDLSLAEEVQHAFMTNYMRVYTNNDIVGVELSAACKNVIAILAGISDGLHFGDNTKAALITRGLAEIIRLGKKAGADPQTFSGLAGIGDLIVTCMSQHSRNRYVGEHLGKGEKIEDIINSMNMVAEGVKNCKSICHYSAKLGVEMPLTEELYRILYENADIKDSLKRLLCRKEKYEHWE